MNWDWLKESEDKCTSKFLEWLKFWHEHHKKKPKTISVLKNEEYLIFDSICFADDEGRWDYVLNPLEDIKRIIVKIEPYNIMERSSESLILIDEQLTDNVIVELEKAFIKMFVKYRTIYIRDFFSLLISLLIIHLDWKHQYDSEKYFLNNSNIKKNKITPVFTISNLLQNYDFITSPFYFSKGNNNWHVDILNSILFLNTDLYTSYDLLPPVWFKHIEKYLNGELRREYRERNIEFDILEQDNYSELYGFEPEDNNDEKKK